MSAPLVPTITTSSLNAAVVLDMGSHSLKIGEAGDVVPGYHLYSHVTSDGAAADEALLRHRANGRAAETRAFIRNGQVTDFDALEAKLRYVQ